MRPAPTTLTEAFEAVAKASPDRVAVIDGNENISYRELNCRANLLAHRLVERGVSRGDRVGVYVDRSVDQIAAILGALKAGAAYVPVDAGYPRERVELLLERADVAVVLCDGPRRSEITYSGVSLDVESDNQPIDSAWKLDLGVSTSPGDAAYVMYTSGSTGLPKGVVVSHDNVLSLFESAQPLFGISAHDVWLLVHSHAFDFSVWELWGALLYGGRAVVVPYWTSRLGDALVNLIERCGATILNQTPTAFYYLLRNARRLVELPTLRLVILGGEKLDYSRLRPWFESAHRRDLQLVNMYGITEATVHTTYHVVRKDDVEAGTSVIGKPLNHVSVSVLDERGMPTAPLATGELYIGGRGVASGYFRQAALTAERFLDSPAPGDSVSKLYRTGDLVRVREDGSLQYERRLDDQMKIRGFRIEPAEIERGLLTHPDVDECAVFGIGDSERQELCAAVVARRREVETDGLRGHLCAILPEHMIPTRIAVVDELPRTANGKLDARALRDQMPPNHDGEQFVAGEPIEEVVAAIWRTVLRRDTIHTADNFFTSGGNSILAAEMVTRLQEITDLQLDVKSVFDAPRFGEYLGQVLASRRSSLPSPVASGGRVFPLSYVQERYWAVEEAMPGSPLFNTTMAYELRGPLVPEALKEALEFVVARHSALRTVLRNVGGRPSQVVMESPALDWQLHEFSDEALPSEETTKVAATEAEAPFDLQDRPPFRVRLLRLSGECHVLMLVAHSSIIDGWSLGVVNRELGEVYAALVGKRTPSLPSQALQYGDFVLWERDHMRGERLARTLDYWRTQLAGVDVRSVAGSRPQFDESDDCAQVSYSLDSSSVATIESFSREAGLTPFIVLHSALAAVLSGRHPQDVVVTSPNANRGMTEFRGVVGPIRTRLVVATHLRDRPSFREITSRVRDSVIGAFSHNIPFELVMKDMYPTLPLYAVSPVSLSMLNWPNLFPQLPDLECRRFDFEPHHRRFQRPLTIFVRPAREQYDLNIVYRPASIPASEVALLARDLAIVVNRGCSNPDSSLGEIRRESTFDGIDSLI